MPTADRNQRYPLGMENTKELNNSWEMSAKRELMNAAITLYQDKIAYNLETNNEISKTSLDGSKNNLRWWRLSEFLHHSNNVQKVSPQSLPSRLKELHGYCLARFFDIIMTLPVETRSKSMFPSTLTEIDKQLVEACLLSASFLEVNRSIDAEVKEHISSIEEGIINVKRLQAGLDHIQWLLESNLSTRSKQLPGYRSLASCYIQMILLYLSLSFSELKSGERSFSEFEKGVTENHQRISTAVSLSRKYDFRLEGASCLSALASQYKILASGGVTGEKTKWNPGKLNHIESALKAYSKAREILGSKHNSPEIWSELNRCRLVTVIEILHFRGMDISDQVKKDLLLSALDEKCKEDWASLDMSNFLSLINAKFTVQRHLATLYKKSHRRKQTNKINSKKLLKEAEENTEMQRRCIETMKLNTNIKNDEACTLMLKTIGSATLDIIMHYKDVITDIPPGLLYQFLIEVFVPDLTKVSVEAEAYESHTVVGIQEWKEVTSVILSLLQIILKHVNSPSCQKSESQVDSLKSLYRECLLLMKQFSDHVKCFHEMLNCLRRLLP